MEHVQIPLRLLLKIYHNLSTSFRLVFGFSYSQKCLRKKIKYQYYMHRVYNVLHILLKSSKFPNIASTNMSDTIFFYEKKQVQIKLNLVFVQLWLLPLPIF